MGIKTLTLALHAASGKPIYVKSVNRYAYVWVGWDNATGKPLYDLQFVGEPAGWFPVVYDVTGQGHIIVNGAVIDDIFEEDEAAEAEAAGVK
ncbi:hypothetical protein A3C89_04105 [Candidatus Kaiserbacteria bacterium RIFCSPHIGHO2_02_FULL_50_50]|uniref:Uncharacterized protein n=1 Tax=Candidatus Kaiserbacteria bacterium RIFCSPHIGHO2_02_FULL_50_50 TaxID=1798492 RepID=A0A1F6DG71_9BACT|nr:MAG: hypothetical protein A3C89_04105 [Candidatus Kaiserbacteria bacterium RIFCSPHIGHO2_02_FULL_50_50]OGG88398.1 MAG: hypothetical protein A3G62_02245 [Candidatus Kaiserbacteria bacterium RIFCSPLOWO2_12_FULL_50_10]